MEIKYQFKENYFSHKHYKNALLWALFSITNIIVISNLYWQEINFIKLFLGELKFVLTCEIWRVFTTSFLHADIGHLMSNSLMYFILTFYLTSYFGPLFSYFIPLIFGGIINYITLLYYGGDAILLGASGVVYYLWGVWISLYLLIQRQKSWWERLLRMGAVFLILLVPTKYEPQTSYFAHYFGLVFGLVIGTSYYILKRNHINSFSKYEMKLIEPMPVDIDYGVAEKEYEKYH